MLKSFFQSSLKKALNQYLALDPESQKRLQPVEGKTITIELTLPAFCFQLSFREKKIEVTVGDHLPAELKIRGTPLNLFALALQSDKKQAFFAEAVTIEGEALLGQQIIDLFNHLEIDWEEHLAELVGDLPAYQIGRLGKKFFAWGKEAKNSLSLHVNDYIHEEQPWFPPREA